MHLTCSMLNCWCTTNDFNNCWKHKSAILSTWTLLQCCWCTGSLIQPLPTSSPIIDFNSCCRHQSTICAYHGAIICAYHGWCGPQCDRHSCAISQKTVFHSKYLFFLMGACHSQNQGVLNLRRRVITSSIHQFQQAIITNATWTVCSSSAFRN